jgi:DNA-binding protein H-NS
MARALTASTIRARIRALELQARRLERSATTRLRAAAAVIAKHGLSLADLRQAFSMSRGRGRSALAGRSVPIKYRDGEGNSWTGRGRSPLWLVAAEKAGKKRESFLIGAKKPKAKAARPKSVKPKRTAAKKPAQKKAPSPATA